MTDTAAQLAVADVLLVLRRHDGRVLFGLRSGNVYASGQWNLPSGKAHIGEDPIAAVIREAAEETSIHLTPADLVPLGVIHHNMVPQQPRVGFVFGAAYHQVRHGAVANREPDRCADLLWAWPQEPPTPLEPYNAVALRFAYRPMPPVVRYGPAVHRMRLAPRWLEAIAAGRKTVEVRVADTKREQIAAGDEIVFEAAGGVSAVQWVSVAVVAIRRYADFDQLAAGEDPAAILGEPSTSAALISQLRGLYHRDRERLGALALRLHVSCAGSACMAADVGSPDGPALT